jgi:signal transduction histidine kinase
VVQAQRRFMADASHELRTPVSIARTAADVTLASRARSAAEYRESLDVIATQMRRLTRIVDDMFMLARADLDARPLNSRDVYLNEIVSDSVRAARVLAATRAVAIDVQGDFTDIPARGDEELLRQLVMNLLDNAIRFSPDGGVVRVSLQRSGENAEVIVEDSGPGIPAADHDRVFERFVRLDQAGADGGAGLGLAIARWIAERHGGTLRVANSGQVSSRFAFSLPL